MEKTKNIKESLVMLLKQLKEKRRITTAIQSYGYNDDGLGSSSYIGELKSLNKGIHALINLNADFESVDDLDSVKKLKETELFFLKTVGLKEFKFPDYKSQINPIFLMYVDIELQLDSLEKKSNDLIYRGHKLASSEAKHIVKQLSP